jgi:hypothetical protein
MLFKEKILSHLALYKNAYTNVVMGILFCMIYFLFIKPKKYTIDNPMYAFGVIRSFGSGRQSHIGQVKYSVNDKENTINGYINNKYDRHIVINYTRVLIEFDKDNFGRANILQQFLLDHEKLSNLDSIFDKIPYDLMIKEEK